MWRGQVIEDAAPTGLSILLMPPQATQSLCQLQQGGQTSRHRLVDSKIGEAGYGDEHHGARATVPVGWQHAHMWAPPEACRRGRGGRRHVPGWTSPSMRRWRGKVERFIPRRTTA
jgi:hypothetical protein